MNKVAKLNMFLAGGNFAFSVVHFSQGDAESALFGAVIGMLCLIFGVWG